MIHTDLMPDITSALSTLVDILKKNTAPVNRFLQQIGMHRIVNPFENPGDLRIGNPIPDDFWTMNGIRRIVEDHVQPSPASGTVPDLLGGSSLVEFVAWADAGNASTAWQNLYSQSIKTLDKRDFSFIFHLGDPVQKRFFEVDEVLDIMGDYSTHGHVTLILDSREADDLWRQLNGWDREAFVPVIGSPSASQRYLSIFNTTRFDAIIVLDGGRALYFSRNGQFELEKRLPMHLHDMTPHRCGFSAGYQLGLLLQLDAVHCTALGIAVSGGYPALYSEETAGLIDFIHDWLSYLN